MQEQPAVSGISLHHAILLLDGSGSMKELEQQSGEPKHRAVAKMVQDLINEMHDSDEMEASTQLSIICYDSNKVDDIRVQGYDVKAGEYYQQGNLDLWDPIIGHGGGTPIGRALSVAREMAEKWVNEAQGEQSRRVVIYLLSDGMNYPDTEPNGMVERQKIKNFNEQQMSLPGGIKGRIRTATVGYFQSAPGANPEEDKGRELLKSLPDNRAASFFETASAKEIAAYVVRTMTH